MSTFILEPLVTHQNKEEFYVAIYSKMDQDVILFYEEGGVEIGDVDAKARQLIVPVQVQNSEMVLSAEDLSILVGDVGIYNKKSVFLI